MILQNFRINLIAMSTSAILLSNRKEKGEIKKELKNRTSNFLRFKRTYSQTWKNKLSTRIQMLSMSLTTKSLIQCMWYFQELIRSLNLTNFMLCIVKIQRAKHSSFIFQNTFQKNSNQGNLRNFMIQKKSMILKSLSFNRTLNKARLTSSFLWFSDKCPCLRKVKNKWLFLTKISKNHKMQMNLTKRDWFQE